MSEQHSQKPKPKIIAAIPCYNEDRFIGSVVAKTKKYVDKVIVIDDGSTDDSGEVAKAAGARVFRHEPNQGYGAAICSALEKGRSLGADILVTIDGDGQHDPKEIPHLIQPILNGEADVVVGSRFLDKENRSPFYRRVGQRVLTTVTNMGSGHSVSDSQSGCRAYSSKSLKEIRLSERGMSVSSEIQFAIRESGLIVAEVPIDVIYEDKAKRNPVGHGFSVLSRVIVLFILRHPLILFGLPGLVLLIAGLIVSLRVMSIYDDTGNLAVGNALIAILLGSGGLLSVFGALMLQAMKELVRGEKSPLAKELKESDLE